jgi:transcription elongation factor GreA
MAEVWLSETAFEKLSKELEHRKGDLRQEITDRIAAARAEGDLKENGGYHAARDEQGKNEAKIVELEHKLETAKVGNDPNAPTGGELTVQPGALVTAEFNSSGNIIKFILGSRENADELANIDAFSPSSAMGQAVLGAKAGETRTYKAPNGRDLTVRVIEIAQND